MRELGQYLEDTRKITAKQWMDQHPEIRDQILDHPGIYPTQVYKWLSDELPDFSLTYHQIQGWMAEIRGKR